MNAAVEAAAAAASALYGVENSATTLQASNAGVHIAVEHLGRAIKSLQEVERINGKPHPATERVARTLALLYPVARASLRQRRDVVVDTGPASERLDALRALANVPPAPPAGRPRRSSGPFGGRDQRSSGDRVMIEVDIGVLTESHFYAGLSQDLSRGGVFIAGRVSPCSSCCPPGTKSTPTESCAGRARRATTRRPEWVSRFSSSVRRM
jgi:hypothetical protein